MSCGNICTQRMSGGAGIIPSRKIRTVRTDPAVFRVSGGQRSIFSSSPAAGAVVSAQGDAAGQHRSQAGIFERHRLRCGIYGEWHLRMD